MIELHVDSLDSLMVMVFCFGFICHLGTPKVTENRFEALILPFLSYFCSCCLEAQTWSLISATTEVYFDSKYALWAVNPHFGKIHFCSDDEDWGLSRCPARSCVTCEISPFKIARDTQLKSLLGMLTEPKQIRIYFIRRENVNRYIHISDCLLILRTNGRLSAFEF